MPKLKLYPAGMAGIAQRTPDTAYNRMLVGQSGSGACRALLKFDTAGILDGASIQEAIFMPYLLAPGKGAGRVDIAAHLITESWDESTVSWNGQPSYNASLKSNTVAAFCPGVYAFDLACILQAWSAGAENNGVIFVSGEKRTGLREIAACPGACAPYLAVSYTPGRGQAACRIRSSTYFVGDFSVYTDWERTCDSDMYTFFVQNIGNNSARANVQISPDGNVFADEKAVYEIHPGDKAAIVPGIFTYFTRLALNAEGGSTEMEVWYQQK